MFMEFIRQQEWLDATFFGNPIVDYVLAALTFSLLWAGLVVLEKYGMIKLEHYLAAHRPRLKGIVTIILQSIFPMIVPLVAFHFAIQRLNLPPTLAHYTKVIVLLGVIFQATYLIARMVGFLILHASFGRSPDDLSVISVRTNLSAFAAFAIWTSGLLFFFSNLGIDITTFVTGLGIGGIAIALAAQNILGDVFSSFMIALDKPFEIGDTIQIDTLTATVEQIGLKTTRLRNVNGEAVIMPNSEMTKLRIHNFKRMTERRVAFVIGVTYDTGLEKLKAIPGLIKSAIEKVDQTRFGRCHFLSFGESALNFETVFYVNSPDNSVYCDAQQAINLQIAQSFAEQGIEFAFPTRTLLMQEKKLS